MYRNATSDSDISSIQVLLNTNRNPLPIRDLSVSASNDDDDARARVDDADARQSSHLSTLVRVPGIVISASKLQAKAIRLVLEVNVLLFANVLLLFINARARQCRGCHSKAIVHSKPGFGNIDLPATCEVSANQFAEKTTKSAAHTTKRRRRPASVWPTTASARRTRTPSLPTIATTSISRF